MTGLATPTRRYLMLACAAAAYGCNAKVNEFSAEPRHICPGEHVEVKWNVSGSATISATPSLAGITDGEVPSVGRLTVTPMSSTDISLKVTRSLGEPTGATQKIEVSAAADKPEALTASVADVTASPGCGDGKVWATVHVNRFATDVKVARVSAHEGDRRSYDVDHGGVHATVAPGQPTSAFASSAIAGDWLLTAHLEPNEACGTATIPGSLVVDVATQCH